MVGDGEVEEGQIWEAAMHAGFHKMANLTCVADYNNLQPESLRPGHGGVGTIES
jgi:transketolase N-terminal domain/subunit